MDYDRNSNDSSNNVNLDAIVVSHDVSLEPNPVPPSPPPTPPTDVASVFISTTFHPHAKQSEASPPDIILRSTDGVLFYVQVDRLLAASDNEFDGRLVLSEKNTHHDLPVLDMPDDSAVLNVILHEAYLLNCAQFSPSVETLHTATRRLVQYGIRPPARLISGTPLYVMLLSHAPFRPLETYALAASLKLEALAVAASSHLLSIDLLQDITEDTARLIGAVYLRRLYLLHFRRLSALRRVLIHPPRPHPQTASCGFADQSPLSRAWTLAAAALMWDAKPSLSIGAIEAALRPLEARLSCDVCLKSLQEHTTQIIRRWSIVQTTI